jgi:hypothetical protein
MHQEAAMSLWLGLLVGLLIGWLVEWAIDWWYWRRSFHRVRDRYLNAEAEKGRLAAQLAEEQGLRAALEAEAAQWRAQRPGEALPGDAGQAHERTR